MSCFKDLRKTWGSLSIDTDQKKQMWNNVRSTQVMMTESWTLPQLARRFWTLLCSVWGTVVQSNRRQRCSGWRVWLKLGVAIDPQSGPIWAIQVSRKQLKHTKPSNFLDFYVFSYHSSSLIMKIALSRPEKNTHFQLRIAQGVWRPGPNEPGSVLGQAGHAQRCHAYGPASGDVAGCGQSFCMICMGICMGIPC